MSMISELAKNVHPNINITVSYEDLKTFAKEVASEHQAEQSEPVKTPTHSTANETAKELRVNLTTLWRWEKSGYLKPIRVGRKRLYRRSDIDKILNQKSV